MRAAVNSIDGLDYDDIIAEIQADPQKYDDVWIQSQDDFAATGQGGVPTMAFDGEPFFGQDRFDQLFWRLRQNGLTKRQYRREPMVAEPLRFPEELRRRLEEPGDIKPRIDPPHWGGSNA